MKVHRSYENEYPVGIVWNMGNKYARDIMLKIAIMEDVVQVKVLDLKNSYEQFVLDCYEGDTEAYDGGYIYEKIKNMKANNNKIIAFVLKIDNPTYQKDENGKIQCIEARKIKRRIREEYAPKMKGYFFDNLIHISDNVEETRQTLEVLNKYGEFTIENYVRKGYEPIIKKFNNNSEQSYTNLLKKLSEDSNER